MLGGIVDEGDTVLRASRAPSRPLKVQSAIFLAHMADVAWSKEGRVDGGFMVSTSMLAPTGTMI